MEFSEKKLSKLINSHPQLIEFTFAFVLFTIIVLPFYKQFPNSIVSNRDEFKHLLIAQSLTKDYSLHAEALKGIQYPPGWGAVIGFLLIIFDHKLQPIHAMTTVLAWLTGPLVYIYLRKRTEAILALAIGIFFSSHFLTITLGDTILSEPIFAAAFLLCLILLHLSMNSTWYVWILSGIFITLCMSFRTIGISLWVGAFFYLSINSKSNLRIKLLHIFCLSIIPLLYLLFLNLFYPQMGIRPDAGYGRQLLNVGITNSNGLAFETIKRTLIDIPAHTRDLIKAIIPISVGLGSKTGRLCLFTALGLIILAMIGWAKKIWRNPSPTEYSFACYIGICYLWPYTGYPRFYWPVVPLIVFYAITSFTETKFYKKWFIFSNVFLVIIIIITTMISFTKNLNIDSSRRLRKIEHNNAIEEAVAQSRILSSTPIIATISYYKLMYYFPNLKVCRLNYTNNKESHQKRISKCQATFLLSERDHKRYFDSLLKASNSSYQLVFNKAGVYLWRIRD